MGTSGKTLGMKTDIKYWNDWKWQLKNRIRTIDSLIRHIDLTDEEKMGITMAGKLFTWAVTPYYVSLMDRSDRSCPIRLQTIPTLFELKDSSGFADPLEEIKHSPVELIIRVYPDRVAFTVGNQCPAYCRHCIRKETMVGKPDGNVSKNKINRGIEYIRRHPEIRDVLLTGGDPLLMSDDQLEDLISRLRSIPTVEVIRIGSRCPCTLPQRITHELCRMLEKYHPIYLNTQFNHPKEITPESEEACKRLASAGIPLGNQSVLLRGINSNVETMKKLCTELMRIRVRPYHLFQAQNLRGTSHFRTAIETGCEIMKKLQGFISGLAVPVYLLDTPYGKTPLNGSYIIGREGDDMVVKTWNGKLWREKNPVPA